MKMKEFGFGMFFREGTTPFFPFKSRRQLAAKIVKLRRRIETLSKEIEMKK